MPAVARKGDQERGKLHCTQPKREGAFATVSANGIQMSGQGHKNDDHFKLGKIRGIIFCFIHSKTLLRGSPNVFAEGIKVGRVGDRTGCSKVVRGSPTVFAN